jgi:hypothetical protein
LMLPRLAFRDFKSATILNMYYVTSKLNDCQIL